MVTSMEVLSSASEAVNDNVMSSPGPTGVSVDEIWTGLRVGAVVSILTVVPCVTVLTGVPTFAAISLNVIVNVIGPCGSVDATVMLAVHAVLTHVTGTAERPAIVTAVLLLSSVSDAVNERVTTSSIPVGVLSAVTETAERVGGTVSMTATGPCVTALTTDPGLPARSVYVIVNATAPCGSNGAVDATTSFAVHTVPTHVTPPTERCAIVTTGVLRSISDDVNERVITSPRPAGVSAVCVTGDSVGATRSTTTPL
jgi:hypothetical protein